MTTPSGPGDYELLDCGEGRRLERFGTCVVDRPAPQATELPRADDELWAQACGRFDRSSRRGSRWTWRSPTPEPWQTTLDGLILELRAAAGGQVGVFPEQRSMWSWVARQIGVTRPGVDLPTAEVLNLFAYTGGMSLVAARTGARVTHVDASRTTIAWARRNAELSGLADRPIRWLTDDAESFVRRELRRGRAYDGVVLDPPSYGHAPDGTAWRFGDRIGGLLDGVAQLVSDRDGFVLVTAHSTEVSPEDLRASVLRSVDRRCDAGWLEIGARSGARLRLGAWAGVTRGRS